jgi:hypothetical protein
VDVLAAAEHGRRHGGEPDSHERSAAYDHDDDLDGSAADLIDLDLDVDHHDDDDGADLADHRALTVWCGVAPGDASTMVASDPASPDVGPTSGGFGTSLIPSRLASPHA